MVEISEIILDAFEAGHFCRCKPEKYINRSTGQIETFFNHAKVCDGAVKLSILLERKNEVRSK